MEIFESTGKFSSVKAPDDVTIWNTVIAFFVFRSSGKNDRGDGKKKDF